MALAASAGATTCGRMLHELIYPSLHQYSKNLRDKVSEILRPHQQGHPITYNHYLTETIQKVRQAREKKILAKQLRQFFDVNIEGPTQSIQQRFNASSLLEALSRSTEADMDRHAAAEAIDCMEAYYKVAMKVLVENFSVLAIENCVISDLANCLSPEQIMKLDDVLVSKIAAETEDSRTERRRNTDKLQTLKEGMLILDRFSRFEAADIDESESGDDTEDVVPEAAKANENVEPSENEEPILSDTERPYLSDTEEPSEVDLWLLL